jgi:serine/threonine-protein kinase RsbW
MTASQTWIFDQFIASDLQIGNQIVLHIVSRMEEMGWRESELFGIQMALEEAIVNAIKHGNRCDREKRVHIVVEVTGDSFYLRVTDEGQGFDPGKVPDCTADENLEECSGRGLKLLNHYMDEVLYNEAGNSLEVRKRRWHPGRRTAT